MTSWCSIVNDAGFPMLAQKFGLKQSRMKSWGPCPMCKAENRSSTDRRGPIGLTPNQVGWMCHKCKATGDVADFVALKITSKKAKESGKIGAEKIVVWLSDHGFVIPNSPKPKPKDSLVSAYEKPSGPIRSPNLNQGSDFRWSAELPFKYQENLFSNAGQKVLQYLVTDRKLDLQIIKDACLGCMWIDKGNTREYWLSIPHMDDEGNYCNIRFRSIPPAKKRYRVCSGRPMTLYGADSLADVDQQVVVVEGELDVLAMRSVGYLQNVVSGTAGAAANWPDEWLNKLEDYQQFLLWYDNDQAGDDGSYKLAKRLGLYRCFRVTDNTYNDVGEALQRGENGDYVENILYQSKPFLKSNLKKVDVFAEEIENLILNPTTLVGLPTGSKKLDYVLGGIMSGLWVVTGDSGHGKTTWATWLLMKQAMMGIPVMLTSFEQRPIGTVQKLLRAYVGGDFTKVSAEERKKGYDAMSKLPLWIFDHYGELSFEHLIETIRFSARRHDLKIALIDHLGFLVTSSRKSGEDERHVIERIVRKLATVAVQDDITIMLVCHPNNTNIAQQRRVKMTDLKGASAIRQDAHVAIVVERLDAHPELRPFPATAIHVDKVRSEFGSNGSKTILAFDPLACVYADSWEDTPSALAGRKIMIPPPPKPKPSFKGKKSYKKG